MKNMFESPEVFEAYAVIDCCYYELGNLNKELNKPEHPLNKMIYESTGYGKAKTKEIKESTISLLEQIIEAKKLIEADYESDEKMLNAVKGIES